ncbi:MAG: carboxypeptidase regulatory-like domain-containing protein, partial [Rhodospirillales bacterium]
MPITRKPKQAWCARRVWRTIVAVGATIAVLGLVGPFAEAAKGPKDKGPKVQGPFVQISGTVTNALTGLGVGDVSVTFAATSVSFSAVTDANGEYAEKLPLVTGGYDVSFAATNFNTLTLTGQSFPKGKVTLNAALDPLAPVIVTAQVMGDALPGGAVTAMGSWIIMDGSTFVGSEWTQSEGAAATIADPAAATTAVDLASVGDFKAELIHLLKEPPVGPDELPPNVEVPPGEFVGGLQDRFQVVGINHLALERAGEVALHFAVTTTSGTYSAEVAAHTALDWRVNPGIRNVPIDSPVLLYGKEQSSYDWMLTGLPSGSMAILADSASQTPEFVPDLPGLYAVEELTSGTVLEIHAGTWRGVIVGQDANGRPIADAACTGCHSGGFAPDTFSEWKETGHAEIFSNNLNNNDHYGENCFFCHTVGFDPEAFNEGIDEEIDYDDFIMSDLLPTTSPDNWTRMLAEFPNSAKKANIQCENCHGPQNGPTGSYTTGHAGGVFLPDVPRVSLSSEVCANCHGEPLRHARFQQWQLSRHANYELAIDESGSGNCSRCHTGNGFLTWLPVLTGEVPGDPLDDITVTWTADEAHPQTCVTFHDPHNIGTTSGYNTNSTVRVSDDTPPLVAGFQAFGVGKGAMCMTCHNTRRGLRNDATWPSTTDRDRAPHGGVQADLV